MDMKKMPQAPATPSIGPGCCNNPTGDAAYAKKMTEACGTQRGGAGNAPQNCCNVGKACC